MAYLLLYGIQRKGDTYRLRRRSKLETLLITHFHADHVSGLPGLLLSLGNYSKTTPLKIYGPKGTGALYVRRGTRIDSLIHGGEQERGLRAGTENVPAIVGLGKAIENANRDLDKNAAQTALLRDRLISGIMKEIPGTRLNGTIAGRLPNNCNISFDDRISYRSAKLYRITFLNLCIIYLGYNLLCTIQVKILVCAIFGYVLAAHQHIVEVFVSFGDNCNLYNHLWSVLTE